MNIDRPSHKAPYVAAVLIVLIVCTTIVAITGIRTWAMLRTAHTLETYEANGGVIPRKTRRALRGMELAPPRPFVFVPPNASTPPDSTPLPVAPVPVPVPKD